MILAVYWALICFAVLRASVHLVGGHCNAILHPRHCILDPNMGRNNFGFGYCPKSNGPYPRFSRNCDFRNPGDSARDFATSLLSRRLDASLLTGANGFTGGAVANALIAVGRRVRGLVRDKMKAELVATHGIEAVVGPLGNVAVLYAKAQVANAAVNAASSDHHGAVEVLIAAMSGSG
jgi:hypothetical protein